jgi:hypothetical protein
MHSKVLPNGGPGALGWHEEPQGQYVKFTTEYVNSVAVDPPRSRWVKSRARIHTGMNTHRTITDEDLAHHHHLLGWLQSCQWNLCLHFSFCNPRVYEEVARERLGAFMKRLQHRAAGRASEHFEAPFALCLERGPDDGLVHAHGVTLIESGRARKRVLECGEDEFIRFVENGMESGTIPVNEWDRGRIRPQALITEIRDGEAMSAVLYATKNCIRDRKMDENLVIGGKGEWPNHLASMHAYPRSVSGHSF